MTRDDILVAVKELGLPPGEYVVYGSCPLAMVGICEAGDIDMLVSPALFADLQQRGWKEISKGEGDKPVTSGVFEAHPNWLFSPYAPTLEHLLATADTIDGIAFANLDEVRKWKEASGRPKDFVDIELIDDYLKANK